MLRTKTPRSRGGKARRAPGGASAVKPAKAEGRSPSGELSLQLEHVSLISFLSDRRPAASAAGLTPFEALLEEEDGDGEGLGCYRADLTPAPPLPQPQSMPPPPPPTAAQVLQASPMDADETMEEKDCCILSQDFFWYVLD
jgi:wee1-like protein kinase